MNEFTLVWALTCAFMIHDFEEIIVIEGWLQKHQLAMLAKIPRRFHGTFHKIIPKETKGFAVGVFVEYVGIVILTAIASINPRNPWLLMGSLAINSALFVHCFSHIGQSFLFKRYAPGVVTAVVVLIPYGLYFYHWLLRERMITATDIAISVPVGLILAVVLNQVGLSLGKRLERNG